MPAGCLFDAGGGTAKVQADAAPDAPDARPMPDADPNAPDADPTQPDSGPGIEFRVNVAGGAFTGIDLPGAWAADGGECDGLVAATVAGDILNTADDPLYRDFEYSDLGATITCSIGTGLAGGDYEVMLVFGEAWFGSGCPGGGGVGSRNFDIVIEGVTVESNLDTLVETNCIHPDSTTPGMPLTRTFDANVTDGSVTIQLVGNGTAQSVISGIQVRQL